MINLRRGGVSRLELLLPHNLGSPESTGQPSMGLKIENFTDD
jgi:hypothetical protein